jgi:hypothetical protein
MGALKKEIGLRSLATLLLPLVALGILSGCVSGRFYWGPSLSKCSGQGSAAQFGSGACRNGAENYVAWKKSKRPVSEADQGPNEN